MGPDGFKAWRLAQGIDPDPVVPTPLPERLYGTAGVSVPGGYGSGHRGGDQVADGAAVALGVSAGPPRG